MLLNVTHTELSYQALLSYMVELQTPSTIIMSFEPEIITYFKGYSCLSLKAAM